MNVSKIFFFSAFFISVKLLNLCFCNNPREYLSQNSSVPKGAQTQSGETRSKPLNQRDSATKRNTSQSGQPENGQPPNGQPENGQPENGQPENGQPPNGQPPNDGKVENKGINLLKMIIYISSILVLIAALTGVKIYMNKRNNEVLNVEN